MPARDIYHETAKQALINDGWIITDDPYKIEWGKKKVYVDLGAERLLTAEKAGVKIAVEVKSFVGKSDVADLEDALGQFMLYQALLEETEPERLLYLAVHAIAFDAVFKDEQAIGHLLLKKKRLRLLVFEPQNQEILLWIP